MFNDKEGFLEHQRLQLSELREVANSVTQSPMDVFEHRLKLGNIDVWKLKQDLDSILVFDNTLHREISCLLEALFYPYTDSPLHDRVRSHIEIPKLLDGSTIFVSGLAPSNDLFVIKATSASILECLYEYIIGKLVINPLREEIPNFVYTYAYHECNKYNVATDRRLGGWCVSDEPQTGYLYLEKINGISFESFCREYAQGGTVEFVEVMLQIINALYVAYKRFSFLHKDLHGNNIIVREISSPMCIPITVLGGRQYLCSRWIPQIIDLGTATAIYEGQPLLTPLYYNTFDEYDPFPYDIYMRGMWEDDEYPKVTQWLKKLTNDVPAKDRNFTFIASSFIETMGYNPLRNQAMHPTLPLHVINNTQRFYERYSVRHSTSRQPDDYRYQKLHRYDIYKYYDLMDMIDSYNLFELRTQVEVEIDPTMKPLSDVVEKTLLGVEQLVKDFPLTGERDVNGEYTEGVYLQIDRLYDMVDQLYVLKSYQRMVLPILITRNLVSVHDEVLLEKAIEKVSHVYNRKIEEVQANAIATQNSYYYQGYNFREWFLLIAQTMSRLFLLPRSDEI